MALTASTAQLVALPLAVVSLDIIRRLVQKRIERKGYPLPPGPIPLPLLGSALSVSIEEPFKTYTEWRSKYGDIMYIRLLDMDVVVLNSPSIATELLEKRSQIYSDRPFIATVDPYGHDSNFAFANYGEHWRLCRRIFHQTFRADAAVTFRPMQLRKARQMILNLVDDPSDYTFHYTTFAAGVTMCSIYDYDPSPRNDRMVSIINSFVDASFHALTPEKAILLKAFPFLLRIPDWFPGSQIKREARAARELGTKTVETPYHYVQQRMQAKQVINPSMVSDHITRMEKLDGPYRLEYEKALKHTSTTAFFGSVETTSSSLVTFTLAMVKNPHVLKRAQAEIDAVVGTDRLPEFDDRSSLPYVEAILRETLRWQPPIPLGVPHATIDSDIYNGFYIPKGATVFGNIWAMSRDEIRYPNAERFVPQRFLDANGVLTNDVPDFVFGFGRRICPGRHTAYASLWSAMATMLATLDFNHAKDASGEDVPFEATFVNGVSRHALPFSCRIAPRAHVTKATLDKVLAQ